MDFFFWAAVVVVLILAMAVYKVLATLFKKLCADKHDPERATPAPYWVPPVPVTVPTRTSVRNTVEVPRVHYRQPATYPTPSVTPPVLQDHVSTAASPCVCTGIIKGTVTYVGDGDGFRVFHQCPGQAAMKDTLSIRLAGIDAPEMGKKQLEGQAYSKESKEYLWKLIRRKEIFLETFGVDQYGRILAMAYLSDPKNPNEVPINVEIVVRGFACVYTGRDARYGKYKEALIKAESTAKTLKIGIWTDGADVVTPMEYKRQQRVAHPQPIGVH